MRLAGSVDYVQFPCLYIMVIREGVSYPETLTTLSGGVEPLLAADFVPTDSCKGLSAFVLNYKTELCHNWEIGFCEFGPKCAFAHGKAELRKPMQKSAKYKTKLCKQFHTTGYCAYGPRCQFIHEETHSLRDLPTAPSSRRNSIDAQETRRLPVFIRLAEGESLQTDC